MLQQRPHHARGFGPDGVVGDLPFPSLNELQPREDLEQFPPAGLGQRQGLCECRGCEVAPEFGGEKVGSSGMVTSEPFENEAGEPAQTAGSPQELSTLEQ